MTTRPPRHVHLIGIGGAGMSAIARVLLAEGDVVSGSDLRTSALTDELVAEGATIFEGHAADHLGLANLVIISSAVPPDNPELQAAIERGIPVVKRAEMLGRLMAGRYGIAVAGTHGKTTTTSMISLILERADLDPTFLVGGELVDLDTNARRGAGPYFVAEADEYDGSFLRLTPKLAVVTNIEADHLDFYGSFEAVVDAFEQFLEQVPPEGHVVACGDDARVRALVGHAVAHGTAQHQEEIVRAVVDDPLRDVQVKGVALYGFGEGNEWQAADVRSNTLGGSDFRVRHKGLDVGDFSLRIPGRHNVLNALAAIVVASILDVDPGVVRSTLATFRGAKRRFQIKGELADVTVLDDYGHHPTEIRATLAATRDRFGERRVICIHQPHTYSRTKNLLGEFATAFDLADEVVITDIYAARERDTLGISSRDLVAAMSRPGVCYVPDLHDAAQRVLKQLRPGDVVLTIGAGNVDRAADEIVHGLEGRVLSVGGQGPGGRGQGFEAEDS